MMSRRRARSVIMVLVIGLIPFLCACDLLSMNNSSGGITAIMTPMSRSTSPSATTISNPTASVVPVPAQSEATRSIVPLLSPNTPLLEQEVRDQLAEFRRQMIQKGDWLIQEIEDYGAGLKGRPIDGWHGWVVDTGREAFRPIGGMSEADWIEIGGSPYDGQNLGTILVVIDNPYDEALAYGPKADCCAYFDELHPLYVLLTGAVQKEGQPAFTLGQKIQFSGRVTHAPADWGTLTIVIHDPDATLVEDRPASSIKSSEFEQTLITLARTSRFWASDPEYKVEAYGNGMVVFHGHISTKVLGYKIVHIDEATLRGLISEFKAADYFSMQSHYTQCSHHAPSGTTSITIDGKSKTVLRKSIACDVPKELLHLEDRIDTLLDTARWIR